MTAVPEPILLVSVEKIAVAYYKSRAEVLEHVTANRIATRHPSSTDAPWVRIMATPGRTLVQRPRVAVQARIQVEAYGGDTPSAQAEAQDLIQALAAVHVVIDEDTTFEFDEASIADGALQTEPWRSPDPDFTPARERYLFDASITFTTIPDLGS